MAYCGRCRIGAVGSDGLCVLCGASQEPETTRTKLAEASGSFLSSLLHPLVLGAVLLIFVSGALGALARRGAQLPGGLPRIPGTSAAALPDPTAGGPWGMVLFVIGPAILQSIALLLLLLLVVFILRRRRGRSERAAETY